MNNYELAAKVKNIATNYKTLYVMGCFGAPLTAANKKRYTNNHSYNRKPTRTAKINAASSDTFGFDCVCLIKGVLWGWNGNKKDIYGGAKYDTNGVPDIGADAMIGRCKDISTNFKKIEVGEALWCKGHIGVYISNGLAVECSPAWANKVQITAVNKPKTGYQTRVWTKHGKLPWVTYLPKGDVNFDGKVTSADARLVLRAAVKLEKLTAAQILAADMDEDGKISSADARAILNKAVKK